jgi:hypothetical protein
MDLSTADRQADETGGRGLLPPDERCGLELGAASPWPGGGNRSSWCILALSDGTVWRGRSIGAPGPARGRVWAVGSLVLVEGDTVAVLRDLEPLTAGADLAGSLARTKDHPVYGFAGAIGATLPLHASVASAIARGEIGRP